MCRACVYYPWPQQYDDRGWNIFAEGQPCYPFYTLAENMQVRKEWVGVGEDQFHGRVWHFPTRLFPIFLSTFYVTGSDQHSIHHSNPLVDILLFSLPEFWSFWAWLGFWDLLITKGLAFDDHSTCSRSFWMLNRDICTVLKWTGVLMGYEAVILCRGTMLYMYFRQLFSPASFFCSGPLPQREGKLL